MTNLLKKDRPLIWLEDLTNSVAINYLKRLGYIILEKQESTSDYLMI